ncbi:MAG: beta-lactamase family protein [Gemmatimonadaceae bacterium]|jgi:CubicO group peptidase (beta-lactamase class C family)|nr:beta-lactamase family protein [Gemmatimonadaceae bacterium]
MFASARAVLAVLVCLLPPLSSPTRAAAQPANARARLDSLFTILESNDRTMGSVTVRKGDRVLYQRSIGFRDSSAAGWVTADSLTMHRIGSVAKPFTAVMIYQLIDERRLSLDTKLSRFYPQLPNSDAITIRDLLGHTSGLGDPIQGIDVFVPLTRDALIHRMATVPIQFPPGTRRRYNNGNFLLLGYIVESVTGSTYAAELERRIVRRAALRRTRVGGAVTPAHNESRAYYFAEGHWEQQRDDAIENAGGAGGLVSTTADLTRFLTALFRGRLISAASLTEMTRGFVDGAQRSGKGLGPFEIPGTTKTGFTHDGSIGAHTALMGYVPEDSLSVALTVNGHNYPINRLFFHVWDILYGRPLVLPSFARVELPDSIARAHAGVYSAREYGLTITIRTTDRGIEGQTEGQDPFQLTYIGQNRYMNARDGILLELAEPVAGVAPRFTLFQQKLAIRLTRAASTK